MGDTLLADFDSTPACPPRTDSMHFQPLISHRTRRVAPPILLFRLVGICLTMLSFTTTTYAADLSGTWTASGLRVSWSIGDWGQACGPRPSGGGESGGTVTLTPQGADFKLSGLGRSYSSNQCWERMPGLSPTAHSAGSATIQTTCKMPAGDPRQATVITSWYPRGNELYFDETGQYQFVLSGSNCTASVRRTRVLTRVIEKQEPTALTPQEKPLAKDESKTPLEANSSTAPRTALPPPPAKAAECANAGKAVSLEITPKTKLMRAGETFQFQATARDKDGCRRAVQTQWKLVSGEGGVLKPDGTLSVQESAPTGTLQLEARVDDRAVTVNARVVSESDFEALIAGGGYGVMGESLDAARVTLSTSHVELGPATESEDEQFPRTWAWLIGGLLALLGSLVLFLVFGGPQKGKNRRKLAEGSALHEVPVEASTDEGSDSNEGAGVAAPPTPPKPTRLCPVCGKRYEDDTMFCVEDGARLVRSN